MNVLMCQMNSIAGNVQANLEKMLHIIKTSSQNSEASFLVFPELALPGACAGDWFLSADFLAECESALQQLDKVCRERGISALVGTIRPAVFDKTKRRNTLALIGQSGGAFFDKMTIVSEDVSDEHRYFEADSVLNGVWRCPKTGFSIGIAHWSDRNILSAESFFAARIDRVILVGACPFEIGSPESRCRELAELARKAQVPVMFVNAIGGGDHVVYDGGSAVVLPDGTMPALCKWLEEDCVDWDMDTSAGKNFYPQADAAIFDPVKSVIDVLCLGLKDYMEKCGFRKVLLGNSGGIDSAVTAALAVRALGAKQVIAVSMPGPYTTDGTRTDSDGLSVRLGITQLHVPIVPVYESFVKMMSATGEASPLTALFDGDSSKINKLANENVQARLRGTILMWISNALGSAVPTLLLSTGNKSEATVGYCTLYGDSCGGLNLIGDLTKCMVYKVAEELNRQMGDVIPESIIVRAPSAELAPGQKDQDSLPPYPLLDEVIERLIVEQRREADVVDAEHGIDDALVQRIAHMMKVSEYKRKQVPACVRVTAKAFGPGRRMPLACGKEKRK